MMEKYEKLWDFIEEEIDFFENANSIKFSRNSIKFSLSDEVPMNKMINIPVCILSIPYIFKRNGKYYIIDRNFSYDNYLCNSCSDMLMKAISFKNVAIIYSKGKACRVNFSFMTKNEATKLLNNSVLNSKGVL